MNAVLNWSGGKDSCLCLHKVLDEKKYNVRYLLTTINNEYNRISMHGVRNELLELQSKSIGIPVQRVMVPDNTNMNEYNEIMNKAVKKLTEENIEVSIFGDIFLEDLRKYREEQLQRLNMKTHFPLWMIPTKDLITEFLECGFKTVVACVNKKYLDKSFVGREIDYNFLNDLPANVDHCGEYGEYHSFVYDGPIFKEPIKFTKGEIVYKNYKSDGSNDKSWDTGFWYCDLIPEKICKTNF